MSSKAPEGCEDCPPTSLEAGHTTHLINVLTDPLSCDDPSNPQFEAIFAELRRKARSELERRPNERKGVTSLISDLFTRIMSTDGMPRWTSREHFYGTAVTAMRRILIDEYKRSTAKKRGGSHTRRDLDIHSLCDPMSADPTDVLSVHELLLELGAFDPRAARVVELRFFGQLPIAQTARVIGISERQVDRDWRAARAWLLQRLREESSRSPSR